MLGLLVARHLVTIVFFVYVGSRTFSFIPILGLLLVLFSSSATSESVMNRDELKSFFQRHAFALAWCCVMFGFWGIADIYTLDAWRIGGALLIVNIVLWLGAYVFDYRDGKEMFHIGYYISALIMFGSLWSLLSRSAYFEVVMGRVALTMALYAFIVFVGGGALQWDVQRRMGYPLFVTANICLMFLIYKWTGRDVPLALALAQVYLMGLYTLIYGIYRRHRGEHNPYIDEDEELFHAILSGKRLLTNKRAMPIDTKILHDLWTFLQGLNIPTKAVIGFFNILLVVGQVVVFTQTFGSAVWLDDILLWFGIVCFFVNYLLLREIGFTYKTQRVFAFVLINFGIYLTIINRYGSEVVYLVGIGIVWSILNSLVMFNTKRLQRIGLLRRSDYLYRIGATSLATLCNIYFIFLLPVSIQLRFSIAFVYFGLQLFLTLYNVKYIANVATLRD